MLPKMWTQQRGHVFLNYVKTQLITVVIFKKQKRDYENQELYWGTLQQALR